MGCETLAEKQGIWANGNQLVQQFVPTFIAWIDREDTLAVWSKRKSTTMEGEPGKRDVDFQPHDLLC